MESKIEIPIVDISEHDRWLANLEKYGVTVVRGAVSDQDVLDTRSMFWDWVESFETGANRDDQNTCINQNWFNKDNRGFSLNANHIQAAWHLRTRPLVKDVFSKIWGTDDLIVSFDTLIVWRQWWMENEEAPKWLPRTEGLHVDQNPFFKKGKHCIQGMIPLFDVNEHTGGTEIIPNTSNDEIQSHLRSQYPQESGSNDDWLVIGTHDKLQNDPNRQLVEMKAGDLLLWDSRTIHGGKIGQGYNAESNPLGKGDLARLSFPVCMTPKSLATTDTLKKRQSAFQEGAGLTHWAHEFHKASWVKNKLHKPIELTSEIQSLIG